MDTSSEDFIRSQTTLTTPSLIPEIKLYLATEVTPLWHMTEEKFGATNMPPPFWAFAWPGGQGLARYILNNPEIVRGKKVLDFAAGSGLAAIAAHKSGAAKTYATDINPLAEAAIQLNAAANNAVVENVTITDMQKVFKQADIIFAGDVCYQQAMSAAVTRWLRLNAEAGKTVIMADPGRAWVPQHGLEEIARYDVPTSRELEDKDMRTVTLWKMV
jgi:predicted nicotinamide N-methyase